MQNKNRGMILLPILIVALFAGIIVESYVKNDDLTQTDNIAAATSVILRDRYGRPIPTPAVQNPLIAITKIMDDDKNAIDQSLVGVRKLVDKLLSDTLTAADTLVKTDKQSAIDLINSSFDYASGITSIFSRDVNAKIDTGKKAALDKIGNAPVVTVTSVSPTSGPAGTIITLTGTGFSDPATNAYYQDMLCFLVNSGCTNAYTRPTSDTEIKFTVPASVPPGTYSMQFQSYKGSTVYPGSTFTQKFTVTAPSVGVSLSKCLPTNIQLTTVINYQRTTVEQKLVSLKATCSSANKLFDGNGRPIAFFRLYCGGANPGPEILQREQDELKKLKEQNSVIEIGCDYSIPRLPTNQVIPR